LFQRVHVELADEIEQVGGRGVEVGREGGDLGAQLIECVHVHASLPSTGRL